MIFMTVREAHQSGVEALKACGFDDSEARFITRLLLDKCTATSHAHLVVPQQNLHDDKFFDDLERIASGEPLAYVLGQREFFGLDFKCDARALIPRPETELLIELAVEKLENAPRVLAADLGTGSGAIAVSVARALPQSVVFATDVSPDTLQLARENAARNGVENRIAFVEGEYSQWAKPLQNFAGKFDVVLSNPPYIARAEIENLQTQVRDYEPRGALDGGEDGLNCYREIAAQCGELLAPGGFLAVELGAGQHEKARAIFQENGWRVEEPIYDFAGHARVLAASRQSHED